MMSKYGDPFHSNMIIHLGQAKNELEKFHELLQESIDYIGKTDPALAQKLNGKCEEFLSVMYQGIDGWINFAPKIPIPQADPVER